ncbi:trigger factor [Candidatus Kuenenbacteria bacterium HGW-Kuenenbacteria-1]|uniref:Trigger factor n=1 Tax=Candidatus Kuenenbacteria bacterium HGW-Kuenenbacteria-1 TaxID=2013812 RepID=A0A2N1UNT1_9BACT|nr:MAG: trigger factor [Candidatus Kuenenbacteria bacterium HGW-Kuenenbacteria-1]
MLKEIKKIKETQLELTCEASLEEMAPCLNKAAKRISQQKKIAGFRPGKAPYEVIKKEVGEMNIYQEALDEIVSQSYFKIINEEKLRVIGHPEINIQILIPNQPIVYKATVALLPKVKLCDCKNIKIKKPEIEIKQKQINDVLEDLQKRRAKEILVNREIQKKDKVNVNIEMFLNKVPLEDGQIKDHSIIIGDPYFIPGFLENLIGLKKEENKEFELKMPESYYNKNLANKIINFKVKINSVFQIDLPELNDEFAISLGQFKTLEDLIKQLKENLQIEENLKIEEKLEEEILEKLINQSSFEEISDNLIKSETDKMFLELEQGVLNQGAKIEDYLNHLKKTKEDLEKDFRLLAIKRIKSILIIEEIAENETMQISESEINEEINNLLKTYPANKEIEKQIQSEEYKKHLKNKLLNKKVLDFLKKTCLL